jgi:hypothetical protein
MLELMDNNSASHHVGMTWDRVEIECECKRNTASSVSRYARASTPECNNMMTTLPSKYANGSTRIVEVRAAIDVHVQVFAMHISEETRPGCD